MAKTKIWAHRGASGWDKQYAPENTINSFKKAIEMGADGIEFDVQLTKDDEIIIIHDERIDRTSNENGWVKDFKLSELKKINFNKTHAEQGFVEIPTLKEALELIKENKVDVNIEIKTGLIYYDKIEEKIYEKVELMGLNNRVTYSSFNHYSLKCIKNIAKRANIALLCLDNFIDLPRYSSLFNAVAINPSLSLLKNSNILEDCHKHSLKVNTWTVNAKTDMKLMCEMGVDGFFTNCPDNARKIVDGDYTALFPMM